MFENLTHLIMLVGLVVIVGVFGAYSYQPLYSYDYVVQYEMSPLHPNHSIKHQIPNTKTFSSDVKTVLDKYCMKTISGSEGDLGDADYKLKSLFILFRHGLRTEVTHKFINTTDQCNLTDAYKRFSKTTFAPLMKIIKSFQKFKEGKCTSYQITKLGLAQLGKMGRFLKNKYSDFLKSEVQTTNVKVTSFSRTVFSLLSFLESFSPSLSKGEIEISLSNYFLNETQTCKGRSQYEKLAKERKDWPSDISSSTLNTLKNKTGFSKPKQTELALGKLYCFDTLSSLLNSTKVPSGDIHKLFKHTAKILQDYRSDLNFKRSQFLAVYHFFINYLADSTSKRANADLTVYSGHDITLEAFLSFLDFIPDEPIGFGARFIIETWEYQNSKYFRFLYQGQQIFINNKFISSSHELLDFINKKQISLFQDTNKVFTKLCKIKK